MQLRLILLMQVFNHTCFRASKVLLALYALQLGASPLTIGMMFAMYSLLPVFLAIPAGRLTDRIGVRAPMLIGSAGMALGMLAPFVLPGIAALFVSATLIGSTYVFYQVSVQNLIGAIGKPSERTRNYSTYSLVIGLTALLGPVTAGYSIEHLGGAHSYLMLAALPLLPLTILLVSAHFPRPASTAGEGGAPARKGDLWSRPPLRRALVVAAIIETGNELGNFLIPIYASGIGLSPAEIGLVMGALATAMLLVRALLPVLVPRFGEARVLGGSLLLAATACLLFPFAGVFSTMLGAAFLLGLGIGCGAPLSMVLVYNRSPKGRSGEAMGLRQTVNKSMEVVLPLIFGSLSTALGMLPVFWLVAVLLGSGSAFMARDARRTQDPD